MCVRQTDGFGLGQKSKSSVVANNPKAKISRISDMCQWALCQSQKSYSWQQEISILIYMVNSWKLDMPFACSRWAISCWSTYPPALPSGPEGGGQELHCSMCQDNVHVKTWMWCQSISQHSRISPKIPLSLGKWHQLMSYPGSYLGTMSAQHMTWYLVKAVNANKLDQSGLFGEKIIWGTIFSWQHECGRFCLNLQRLPLWKEMRPKKEEKSFLSSRANQPSFEARKMSHEDCYYSH